MQSTFDSFIRLQMKMAMRHTPPDGAADFQSRHIVGVAAVWQPESPDYCQSRNALRGLLPYVAAYLTQCPRVSRRFCTFAQLSCPMAA